MGGGGGGEGWFGNFGEEEAWIGKWDLWGLIGRRGEKKSGDDDDDDRRVGRGIGEEEIEDGDLKMGWERW